jgi:hypothetical protein
MRRSEYNVCEHDVYQHRSLEVATLNNPETMMKIRQLFFLILLIPLVAVAQNPGQKSEAVSKVIDDFHDAATHGDKQRYFNHLTDDAVYLGTDEWERGHQGRRSVKVGLVSLLDLKT